MTTYPIPPRHIQADEALRLLADLYARRALGASPLLTYPIDLVSLRAYERIRDTLRQASTPQQALEQLTHLAAHPEPEHADSPRHVHAWHEAMQQACELVAEVIQANGNAQVLLAGETDGFRHICRICCQKKADVQHVRFFHHPTRRPLLKAEVSNAAGSSYGRCQWCRQVLVPTKRVVLIPAGTRKHAKDCSCHDCNHAHIASLLLIYACEEGSYSFQFPPQASIAAPSFPQAKKRAFDLCWRHGWYVLFDQPPR